ncbi:tRNA (adenosine(37)-N6)-dimethylallyltransferase MiaA [Polaribacter gangjinensis]|uniref:tRNA dimethylallyltransferase n=1 Tax=Polaribacter gangjinensis TaxID=574710 RepID=A0A2S7W9J4_9FLAO|nr:tRNA (adenosine(37)-N6)-dimethylallyltransferase MiaA [Polaribacter gangjinensis]PQJ74253.1 tRNA (adenosine(37)-N6)-dimethylallyltransferase MiaA [Polaribacter gangjinensis]
MNSQQTKTLITIVGPTAIGKTALSIELANHFNCDIISCDSRQFYKEMTIGTAVPEPEELTAATHHFIQNISIFEDYNVGQFERDSLKTLEFLFSKNPIQIMVGGSGLYVNAVLNGLDDFPEVDASIREKLKQELQEKGIAYLQSQLKTLDIESFETIAIDNPHRIMRALEICLGTQKPYSSFKNKQKQARDFNTILIGLTAERSEIYSRINQRVDHMMQKGLLEEAKKLYPYKNLNALQTVGYRELFDYFDGKITLDFAIEEIKKNTRRFAKRQLTWFRKDDRILWFDYKTNSQLIIKAISERLATF